MSAERMCAGGCGTTLHRERLDDGREGLLWTCSGDGCPGNLQPHLTAPEATDPTPGEVGLSEADC